MSMYRIASKFVQTEHTENELARPSLPTEYFAKKIQLFEIIYRVKRSTWLTASNFPEEFGRISNETIGEVRGYSIAQSEPSHTM